MLAVEVAIWFTNRLYSYKFCILSVTQTCAKRRSFLFLFCAFLFMLLFIFLWVFLKASNQMVLLLTANSLHAITLSSLQVVSVPFLFPFSCQHDCLVTSLRGKITFKLFHPPCCSVEVKLTYVLTAYVRTSFHQSCMVWLCEIPHLLQRRQGILIRILYQPLKF